MTAQLPRGPHESSSLIRSDSLFQTGQITLNGDSGNGLIINNNANLLSTGDAFFENIGITTQVTANNIVILDDTNTIKIGSPSYLSNQVFPELGSTTWTTDIGLGLTNSMTIPDAFNELEQWKYAYLIDTPPPVILGGTSNDNDSLTITWTFHDTVDVGFADIELPHHETVIVQYVKSSLNLLNDFSDGSVITVDTGSKFTNEFKLYIDTGSSGLIGNTWHEYGDIDAATNYDVRIYLVNHNTTNATKYLVIQDLATEAIGVPTAPLNPIPTTKSDTVIGVTYDEPLDHNNIAIGNNSLPYIEQYAINYVATGSVRFGGLIADAGTATTPIAVGTNAQTYLDVENLNPGTTYSLSLYAINSKNPSPGASTVFSGYTDFPPQPPSMDSYVLAFDTALFAPFTAGGYTLSGSTFFNYIINYNNVDGTLASLPIQLSTTDPILINEVVAATSPNPLAIIRALGGVQGSLETVARNLRPFGVADATTEVPGSDIVLGITQNGDYYASGSVEQQGFWRSSRFYIRGDHTTVFQPTNDIYEFKFTLNYFPSASIETSATLTFAIDDINIAPSITNLGFYGILGNNPAMVSWISGVPTYNNTADFNYRFYIQEIGNNYLRNDKLHAQIQLADGTNDEAETFEISLDDIGVSHKYYDDNSGALNHWVVSGNLHNVSGLELEPVDNLNPRIDIQFNDFTVNFLTSPNANTFYSENLQVKVLGKNLYGNSIAVYDQYRDSTGVAQPMRADFYSLAIERSGELPSTPYGQQVNSGDSDFPNTEGVDFGITYDHTQNILTDSGYTRELQLINGVFRTPAASGVFADYSNYFYPVALSITTPDYSTVVTSGFRYATFKFTRSFSGFKNKAKITLINPSGLTVDFSILDSANHRVYIRLEDKRTLSPGDYTFSTNWLDASNAFGIMGVNNAANGDGCLLTSESNTNERVCIFNPFTEESVFYVKIGLDETLDHSIENIQLDIL